MFDSIRRISFIEWMIITLLILFVSFGVFFAVDSIGTTGKNYYVYVIDKDHKPGHMQHSTQYIDGKAYPQNTWIPDSWSVTVNSKDTGNVECDISHGKYEHLKIGHEIIAVISKGRISDNFYCKGLI